ncbi:hypothetical protein Tdes44962_MAKER09820 [Teratosphaeria destructans]|uniref:Uncharacterized protein n=1 Tax=Teratosphaeria destructans TaxID=418781 RepID=A0A9W7SR41_9PEZI|nr:hypothetical protein Tdes44962_MAKER09820 [Teratosphaeria destructans]
MVKRSNPNASRTRTLDNNTVQKILYGKKDGKLLAIKIATMFKGMKQGSIKQANIDGEDEKEYEDDNDNFYLAILRFAYKMKECIENST